MISCNETNQTQMVLMALLFSFPLSYTYHPLLNLQVLAVQFNCFLAASNYQGQLKILGDQVKQSLNSHRWLLNFIIIIGPVLIRFCPRSSEVAGINYACSNHSYTIPPSQYVWNIILPFNSPAFLSSTSPPDSSTFSLVGFIPPRPSTLKSNAFLREWSSSLLRLSRFTPFNHRPSII